MQVNFKPKLKVHFKVKNEDETYVNEKYKWGFI